MGKNAYLNTNENISIRMLVPVILTVRELCYNFVHIHNDVELEMHVNQ